ncbi:hypothetical protein KIPB_016285, partial [Kipferlia bialata]|eukprot:g16285.t1
MFHTIVGALPSACLSDGVLFPEVSNLLVAASGSHFRPLRHAATVCCMGLLTGLAKRGSIEEDLEGAEAVKAIME